MQHVRSDVFVVDIMQKEIQQWENNLSTLEDEKLGSHGDLI
jgi:hypothetical protein